MKTINKQNKFRYARNGFNFSDLLSYLVESYLLYESTGGFESFYKTLSLSSRRDGNEIKKVSG